MGLTLKNLTGYQRGVELAETGINVETFEVRYFPEWKEKLPNHQNQTIGFGAPDALSREVTIQGEISGSTGLMAATHTTAVVPANDIADFDGEGGLYMDEATVAQGRAAWKNLNMRLSGDPLCA